MIALEMRSIIERAYLADPLRTDRDLRHLGYHHLAAKLYLDHEVGRLAENIRILEPSHESAHEAG